MHPITRKTYPLIDHEMPLKPMQLPFITRELLVNILLPFSNQVQIYLLIRFTFVISEVLSDIDSLVLSTAFFSRSAFPSSKESCGYSFLKLLNFSQLFVRGYGIIGPVYHRPDRTIMGSKSVSGPKALCNRAI